MTLIIVHGVGQQHDQCLTEVLHALQEKGITLHPDKCHLGQPQLKWFGYIFSKDGISLDPEERSIIKNWPAPKSSSEVKSFLWTIQFNSKLLGGKPGELSYPEVTEPLQALTRKNARFVWGTRESTIFEELKARLCSSQVLVPYDTHRKTRLYVDSSFVCTQATVAQQHTYKGEEVWRPVNHTSRSWTATEAGYGQVERESNGILTGMHMNNMYVFGTHTEVVTDHKPLLPLYNSPSKSKQPRNDRHRTKLLAFDYTGIYEPGKDTRCDYGSLHPPNRNQPTEQEDEDWCIEADTDAYVNCVTEETLPQAITKDVLREASKKDKEIRALKIFHCIMNVVKIF